MGSWKYATLPTQQRYRCMYQAWLVSASAWVPRAAYLQRNTQLNFCILHLHHPSPRPQAPRQRKPAPPLSRCRAPFSFTRFPSIYPAGRPPPASSVFSRTHTHPHTTLDIYLTSHTPCSPQPPRYLPLRPGSLHAAAQRRRRPRGREGEGKPKRPTRLETLGALQFLLGSTEPLPLHRPRTSYQPKTPRETHRSRPPPPPHSSHPLHSPTTRTGVIPRPLFHHLQQHPPS
jgi:hypothetical protein